MKQFSPTLYYAPLPYWAGYSLIGSPFAVVAAARQAQHDILLVIVPPVLV